MLSQISSQKPRDSDSLLIGSEAQILELSPPISLDMDDVDEFNEEGGKKMTKAEWLMAQCDLDPIESHGSMEMSTQKFKTFGNGKRILAHSERAEESGRSNIINVNNDT